MKVFKIVCRVIFCFLAVSFIVGSISVIIDEINFIRNRFLFYQSHNPGVFDYYDVIIKSSWFVDSLINISISVWSIFLSLYSTIKTVFCLFPNLKHNINLSKSEKTSIKIQKLQKKLDKLNTESGE